MSKISQTNSGAQSPHQVIRTNNGSDKAINNNNEGQQQNEAKQALINRNLLMQQIITPETTDRKLDANIQSGMALKGKDNNNNNNNNNNKQVQFTSSPSSQNQQFLLDAPNIRAPKMDAVIQKNGDSGEEIYMGTQTQERFREKHLTFFQKRLLNTISSENENDTLYDKKQKNTNNKNNYAKESIQQSTNKQNDSFHKSTFGNHTVINNTENNNNNNNPTQKENLGGSKFQQNSARSGNQNQSLNQSMRRSQLNKSDTSQKKMSEKEIQERFWGIKMWYICIIASIIGAIMSIVSFYMSNSYGQSNVLCFVIYPICALLLQTALIAIQRLIFIRIKAIEQQKTSQSLFNREKINIKRFSTWKYFFTVYSYVSIRLILISLVTVIVYAPIIEKVILPKIQPSGGIQQRDENDDFIHSLNERRNYLLAQVVLRFIWVYFIVLFNYLIINQEYTRIEYLAKTEQNQNADRNQYLGQIYKEFENDLIQLENNMHKGLNLGHKSLTMVEYYRGTNNGPSTAAIPRSETINNQNTINNLIPGTVFNIPLTANQVLTKKQSLLQFQMDPKKSNFLDVNGVNNLPGSGSKAIISLNQIETNEQGGNNQMNNGTNTLNNLISGQTTKQLKKQKLAEKKMQLRIENIRDLLQFWIKLSREDIFAMIQNVFVGLTIFLISVILTLNIITNYLVEESEPGYYITFFFYFFFISIVFFKGVQAIHRRQQEISKKVIRPMFFILASVGTTSVHFELATSLRQACILSIIKFFMIILFLHIVPWMQQIMLEKDIQKEIENVFRKSMQSTRGGGSGSGTIRKAKTSSLDFRPSHIVDIREVNHFNGEKKVYQQNRLTLIQFIVAFCITDIASSASFIAVTFLGRQDNNEELVSVLNDKRNYYNIYIVLVVEIICFLLLIILTIYFFKRSIAKSEYDTLKNYSFVTYTRHLVISNLTAISLVYLFAWHFVFLLLNN